MCADRLDLDILDRVGSQSPAMEKRFKVRKGVIGAYTEPRFELQKQVFAGDEFPCRLSAVHVRAG